MLTIYMFAAVLAVCELNGLVDTVRVFGSCRPQRTYCVLAVVIVSRYLKVQGLVCLFWTRYDVRWG